MILFFIYPCRFIMVYVYTFISLLLLVSLFYIYTNHRQVWKVAIYNCHYININL